VTVLICSKSCPIDVALKYVGKKWAIELIKDMFFGMKHFNEFLNANPDLSGKVLSQRLKELEKFGIIEKRVTSVTPLTIEYHLTDKGRSMNKVIYELACFAMIAYEKDCGIKNPEDKKVHLEKAREGWKKALGVIV
jgi:DNA-binding HxlR family transcriptional regulator